MRLIRRCWTRSMPNMRHILNEKWDIKSYEEFAVDCAKKIVEYRADCEKYGTTMEELLKNFDDKMGALPDDDFQAASD